MEISVVIPCYNEADVLEKSVEEVIMTLESSSCPLASYEIILVIEKCSDGSLEIANRLQVANPKVKVLANDDKYGKGYSVRRGVLSSKGDYVLVVDADLPLDLQRYFDIMIKLLESPKSAAVYCTALWDKIDNKKRNTVRAVTSLGLFLLRKTFLRQDISDSQLGCKLYEGDIVRQCFEKISVNNFLYEIYLTDLIFSRGYNIDECAVRIDYFSEKSSVRVNNILASVVTFFKYALFERRKIFVHSGEVIKEYSIVKSTKNLLILLIILIFGTFMFETTAMLDRQVQRKIESEEVFQSEVAKNTISTYGNEVSQPSGEIHSYDESNIDKGKVRYEN